MKRFCHTLLLLLFCVPVVVYAQDAEEKFVEFDRTSFSFGSFPVSQGSQTAVFTFTNVSTETLFVQSVVATCHCTIVSWQRDPILPGAKSEITAVFNPAGFDGRFDKIISVFISGRKKPYNLHIKGFVEEPPLEERYPISLGTINVKDTVQFLGSVSYSSKYFSLSFANVDTLGRHVSIVRPQSSAVYCDSALLVHPDATAELSILADPERMHWGTNSFKIGSVVDGTVQKDVIVRIKRVVSASGLTAEQRDACAIPSLNQRDVEMKYVPAGQESTASVRVTNKGKSSLTVLAAESDDSAVSLAENVVIEPSASAIVSIRIDTSHHDSGSWAVIPVTLITDSPVVPELHLTVKGHVL